MNATHQCLVKGCSNPPTKMVETDVGLEGSLALYFCDQHEAAYRNGEKLDFEADRSEPEGNEAPEA
ncbi:MAG: hypothetical protein AB7P33_09045 [Dehalococcoidia bacterium]